MREYIVKFDTDETPSNFPYGTSVRALMKITGDCDEVIRCKDCKYSVDEYDDGECYCDYEKDLRYIKDWDHYCSWAERKDE